MSEEDTKTLEDLVKQLPPHLQDEVRDFAEFLIERQANKPRRKPRFDWAGGLRDLRDEYTSVELQHKISKWRVAGD